MKTKLYNQSAEVVGELDLPDRIFNVPTNPDLLYQVSNLELANRRKSIAHAKARGEVRGGGKKPWRQKGTGRARHGSIRSPLWKGGGVTHGPTKERKFGGKINKKIKIRALAMVLSDKASRKEIKVINKIEIAYPKTKEAAKVLGDFTKEGKRTYPTMFLIPRKEKNLIRASRNIENISVASPLDLNLTDLLAAKYLIMTKEALKELEERIKL
jgi:large subunit ribosomal protein L4